MRETHRHPWRCRAGPPGGRPSPRPAGDRRREPPPASRPDPAEAGATPQALALCDLVADPRSGITRVTVVGAPPELAAAVREAAAGRGVIASGPGPDPDGCHRVTLRRPPQAGGEAGAGTGSAE
jgi:hypothetical protein